MSLSQTTMKKGARCDTATAFLTPAVRARANLSILTTAHVTRVVLNSDREAVGVAFKHHPRQKGEIVATARKEVILSAGAFGSPALLLHSGIGPKHTRNMQQHATYNMRHATCNVFDMQVSGRGTTSRNGESIARTTRQA